MSMRARVHPSLLVAGAAALLLVLVLLVDGTRWAEIRITDSTQLVLGSHTVVNCIGSGHLVNCYVGGWPLAQYVVAVPFVAAGAADLTTLHVLAALSSLAVGGMLVLVAFPIRRLVGPEWSVVLAITLLTSPFLLYALLPFGEALSAFLTLAFVVAACARRPGWLLVTGLLAGVTKETLAPFVLVLGLVCAREAHDRWFPARRLLVPMLVGLGGAVVLNSAFNVFRFGTVRNLAYTAPGTRVPGLKYPVRLAISDWFAPNVGVLWFWFAAGLLCAGLVIATVTLIVAHGREPRVWLPPLLVVGVLVGYTGGLSVWWSTFGWVAWGPSLTLPIIPAVLVAGIWTARGPMTVGLTWVFRNAVRTVLVVTVVAVLGMAQVGVVWHRAAIELPLVPDARCPTAGPLQELSTDYLYGCEVHEAWRLDPLSLWEASRHGPATQPGAQLVEAIMVAGAGVWLHRRAREQRRARAPEDLRARPVPSTGGLSEERTIG